MPPPNTNVPDDIRRRRLVFRCWHRGMREVDLLLGRYADAHIGKMSEDDLARMEALLDIPDSELLGRLTGAVSAGVEDQALIDMIRAFHSRNPTVQDFDQS